MKFFSFFFTENPASLWFPAPANLLDCLALACRALCIVGITIWRGFNGYNEILPFHTLLTHQKCSPLTGCMCLSIKSMYKKRFRSHICLFKKQFNHIHLNTNVAQLNQTKAAHIDLLYVQTNNSFVWETETETACYWSTPVAHRCIIWCLIHDESEQKQGLILHINN